MHIKKEFMVGIFLINIHLKFDDAIIFIDNPEIKFIG